MKKNSKLSGLYLGILFFLMYLPIGVVVVFSFNEASTSGALYRIFPEMVSGTVSGTGYLIQALKNSLILAVSSCGVSAVIGTRGGCRTFQDPLENKRGDGVYFHPASDDPGNHSGNGTDGIFLYAEPAIWNADTSDRTHGFLCALYFDGGKSKACGNGSVPRRGSQRSWCRFLSGLLGHYPAADHAGCYIRLSAGLCHVHGRCGDQHFCNRATCIHAADKSLHTDENRRYAGDQCTLYHNAGSDPSGTGSISDRRKTREGEYKR